jgi:flagellin-like protein
MNALSRSERAVSPVVGVALLLAITVILAAVVGSVILGSGVNSAGEPETMLSFEVADDDTILLHHEGGEPLVADEIVISDSGGTKLEPGLDQELTTGERREIVSPTDVSSLGEDERITVVWQDPQSTGEQILATFKP